MRQLVSVLCSSRDTHRLCSYQWADMRPEVEAALLRKAHATDMIQIANGEAPDFYAMLFALAINVEDFRSGTTPQYSIATILQHHHHQY